MNLLYIFLAFALLNLQPLTANADFISQSSTGGTQVIIPLQGDGPLPANDLLYIDKDGKSRGLTQGQAQDLQRNSKVNLSKLNPVISNEWKGHSFADDEAMDQALPVKSGDLVTFVEATPASKPRFKIAVSAKGADGNLLPMTILLTPTLHTLLLRKELLRRLGYAVPPMKYISKVRIKFEPTKDKTAEEVRNSFLVVPVDAIDTPDIFDSTSSAAKHWCSVAPQVLQENKSIPCRADPSETDPLVVGFQDVAVMTPSPLYENPKYNIKKKQIFNLALDPPIVGSGVTSPQTDRTYRSLAVIYDLVNFSESINQTEWYAGRVQSENVTFPLPESTNFSCSRDDAEWAINRMNALTRSDIEQMVSNSYFPDAVSKVVVEKIIARRNSLISLFKLNTAAMQFDPKVTDLPDLQNGKILKVDWPGYASNFAYGDTPSPIKGMKYYFLAQIEGQTLDNLIAKANAEIPNLDYQTQINNHQKELNKKLRTGEITRIFRKVWVAPLAGINFIADREVIGGNYLGTNNPIQVVDTMGFSITAGIIMGVDGLTAPYSVNASAQGSLNYTLTHVRPIRPPAAFRQAAIPTSIKSAIAPLVFKGASGILDRAYNLQNDKTKSPEQITQALGSDMQKLKEYIAVGDSLILTESVTGVETVTAQAAAQVPWSPAASITAGPNQGIIRRIQFFRKSENLVQVYVDNGDYLGLTAAFEFTVGLPAQFPIITLFAKKTRGEARAKIYELSIDPDQRDNPQFFANSRALSKILKTGSTAVLDELPNVSPSFLDVRFDDTTTSKQFLMFGSRHLKLNGDVYAKYYDPTAGSYSDGAYIALSDGIQSGKNYQLLATDAATYAIQRLANSTNYGYNTYIAPNPGQTLLGSSKTRDVDFQARYDKSGISSKFIRIQYSWEGWSSNYDQTMKVINTKLNPQYGIKFFDDNVLHDISKIQLFDLATNFYIYEPAINNLLAMSPQTEKALEQKYHDLHECDRQNNTMSQVDLDGCDGLQKFKNAFKHLRKASETDHMKFSKDVLDLVGNFQRFAPFQDMAEAFGGIQNIYINATIDGYRVGTETASNRIYSTQSIGVQDPTPPRAP